MMGRSARPMLRQGWSLCLVFSLLAAQSVLADEAKPRAAAPPPSAKIVLRLSEPLVSLLVSKEVERTAKVDRMLFDARVLGLAQTKGRLALELRSGGEHAAFWLVLRGTTVSKTVAYLGPARIYSVRSTPFEARAAIEFKEGRFSSHPAEITVFPSQLEEKVASTVSGIRGQIVRTLTYRQLNHLRDDLKTIADQDAAEQVCESLNGAVQRRLSRMNRRLRARHYLRAFQSDQADRWKLHVCTTDDYLQVSLLDLLSGPVSGRAAEPEMAVTAPLELWLHRSLLDRRATELFDHWPGLGAALGEVFPALDRPLVRGSGWIAEHLIQLKLARVDDWVVVRAGPFLWRKTLPPAEPVAQAR